jgi:glycine/serine hydroxymethyltransferase
VNEETGLIDYDALEKSADEFKPNMIVVYECYYGSFFG